MYPCVKISIAHNKQHNNCQRDIVQIFKLQSTFGNYERF